MPKQILIVDDSANTRSVLRFLFQGQGFGVVEAQNGAEALEKMKSHDPDLVILDVLMPEMDGFAVCREIKKNPATADVPVILLTAVTQTDPKRDWGKESPADWLIAKPFQLRELLNAVEHLLGLPSSKVASTGSGGDTNDKYGTVIRRPSDPTGTSRQG